MSASALSENATGKVKPREADRGLIAQPGQPQTIPVRIGESGQLDLAGNHQGLPLKHDAGHFERARRLNAQS